jgi:Zn-dependent protease
MMFRNRFRLCDAFGIPIYVDISFAFLLFVFLMDGGTLVVGVTQAILLALSVTMHELGHSLTARAFGYRTTDITISLLGGCASLIALPRRAWQELLTAVAGPLVSFVLSAASFLALCVFPIGNSWLAYSLYYMTYLNLMLGGFNLLPGFPMDGGRIFRSVLRAFLSRPKATFVAMWVGRGFAILLGLSGLHAVFNGGGWGFVRILIAYMIWTEGYREYQLALMESSWEFSDYRARVSPPPYGGDGDDVDVTRG